MTENVLEIKNLSLSFGQGRVLNGLNLTVAKGEYVSLIGESMSGKSVLFKVITGLYRPDDGQVRLLGRDMAGLKDRQRFEVLSDVEMQFQSGALFDSMSVHDNLRFVLDEKRREMPEDQKEAVIDRLLRGVKLHSAADKFPYELSGGMQKRVAVARALATSPELVLFDDPAAGLDPVTSVKIANLIKELTAQEKGALIVATTNVHMARQFAARAVLLKDGAVHADGAWDELLEHGDEYTRGFLARDLKFNAHN